MGNYIFSNATSARSSMKKGERAADSIQANNRKQGQIHYAKTFPRYFRFSSGIRCFFCFTTATMVKMPSELRKYRVDLVLAGQYLSAIKPPIHNATFGNVGNLGIFRIGATDVPVFAKQLGNIRSREPHQSAQLSNVHQDYDPQESNKGFQCAIETRCGYRRDSSIT